MRDVQAILREIVNDLEKTTSGLSVIQSHLLEKVTPMHGNELQGELKMAHNTNQEFYDELRRKIDRLT